MRLAGNQRDPPDAKTPAHIRSREADDIARGVVLVLAEELITPGPCDQGDEETRHLCVVPGGRDLAGSQMTLGLTSRGHAVTNERRLCWRALYKHGVHCVRTWTRLTREASREMIE